MHRVLHQAILPSRYWLSTVGYFLPVDALKLIDPHDNKIKIAQNECWRCSIQSVLLRVDVAKLGFRCRFWLEPLSWNKSRSNCTQYSSNRRNLFILIMPECTVWFESSVIEIFSPARLIQSCHLYTRLTLMESDMTTNEISQQRACYSSEHIIQERGCQKIESRCHIGDETVSLWSLIITCK